MSCRVLKAEIESPALPLQRRSGCAEHSRIGPRQDVTVSCTEDKALCKRHRGVFLSSLQWSTSGRVWLQHWLGFWVFKCTGKGTLFAPNKSRLGLAFLTGAWGKEARQQLKSNKLLPSTTGMARYGQAELVLLFEAFLWVAEAIFFVFAANMFEFSLFWRQVVNASEVHTWHMFLFTCCPPFISCSRCSVYHFKCILIY